MLVLEEGAHRHASHLEQANCLPRVHGSALFTRGKTEALAVTMVATLCEFHLAGRISYPRVHTLEYRK